MKNYQKAEMIAKNLPTGSYAAGCPTNFRDGHVGSYERCKPCELAQ